MHALSYLQKRGHLSMVATGRKMFQRVEHMTPARFDILYVVYEYVRVRGHRETGTIWQALVHRGLGLRRQTVWKAIVRLVELGYLEKQVDPESKQRRILVKPTEDGVRWIRRAYGVAFTERYPVPGTLPGETPPRHAYRVVRDQAWRDDSAAKTFAAFQKTKGWYFGNLTESMAPPKTGREVAKIFNGRIWTSTPRGGNRGKRYLDTIDALVVQAHDLARAFGDTSALLYMTKHDPYYVPPSRDEELSNSGESPTAQPHEDLSNTGESPTAQPHEDLSNTGESPSAEH